MHKTSFISSSLSTQKVLLILLFLPIGGGGVGWGFLLLLIFCFVVVVVGGGGGGDGDGDGGVVRKVEITLHSYIYILSCKYLNNGPPHTYVAPNNTP